MCAGKVYRRSAEQAIKLQRRRSDMQYEEIRCMVCGGDMLERQSDGLYVCKHCRAHFRENDLEEYKETIKGELKGLVT